MAKRRSQPEPPSGAQVELHHGEQSAAIVEVGGALRSYSVGSLELLDGYGPDEACTGARGQTLLPWPNRLRDGCYSFEGEEHQLPLTEPAKHNAIHGLVRWANWASEDRSPDRAVMRHVLHPQPGYPFVLDLSIEYRLGDEGLGVTTSATNSGDSPCPYGAGAHPYLSLGTPSIDPLVLQAPGTLAMTSDEQAIPTGSRPVDGTDLDFLAPRTIGSTVLDTGYSELRRGSDGRAVVSLSSDGGASVSLWMDQSYAYLMLFTGDTLPEPERHRRGLGVEPMTCAPNALASGEGLRILAPGESCVSTWGVTPSV